MEPNNRTARPSRPDFSCEISSPVLRLLQVNDRGMIFESRSSFEIGDAIQLGFHVTYRPDTEPGASPSTAQEFISGQGMVVGCRLCASGDGMPIHEVTLLFSSISERDKGLLSQVSRQEVPPVSTSKKAEAPDLELIGLN